MTVSSTTTTAGPYTGNGSQTSFDYGFKIFTDAEIEVVKITVADGAQTVLTLTTDYTVTGAGVDAGGSVVLNSAPSSAYQIYLRRKPLMTQEQAFADQGRYQASSHERALDRATQRDLYLKSDIDRAAKAPLGESGPAIARLADRAGMIAEFDNSGNLRGTRTLAAFDANVAQVAADRVQTGLDRTQTGADRLQTGSDRTAAASSAASAAANAAIVTTALAVNLAAYSPAGDGVTSDQTAVANAVAAAYAAGRDLYWPAGTYLTTASVPNLHSVRHRGPGAIKRGSALFYVEQREGQTNTLYLDDNASDDTGDGLSASQPVKTSTRIATILSHYGPVLTSKWVIEQAACSVGGVVLTRKFQMRGDTGLVEWRGPTVSVAAGFSVDFILLSQGASGTFQVGETITGGTSGATATVTAVAARIITATIVSGVPVIGETLTGSTSGAVAVISFLAPVPLAIVDQAKDTGKLAGFALGWSQQIQFTNVKTKGFSASGRSGISASRFCDVRGVNYHDDGSYQGLDLNDAVTYRMAGLLKNNVENGVSELFGVTRSIEDGTLYIFNPGGSGLNAKEMCRGHADKLVVDSAGESGIEMHSFVTANVGGTKLLRCPVGFSRSDSEIHEETSVVWGTGADACTRKFVDGPRCTNLTSTGWAGDTSTYRPLVDPTIRYADFSTTTLTGTTSGTNFSLGTLPANSCATKGQRVRVVARGKRTTGSNGTVTVTILLGGSTVVTVIMPTTATASATFEVEFELLCYQDGDFQRCFGKSWEEGALSDAQTVDRTETWTANDKALVLRFTPSHASDSITINDIRMYA